VANKPGYNGGDLVFELPNLGEQLRLKPDGKIIVRGEQLAVDRLLYLDFRDWLAFSSHDSAPGSVVGALADGHNITLSAGAGRGGGPDGDMVFENHGLEMLRIRGDGTVLSGNVKLGSDGLVGAFRAWLRAARGNRP
jgi:hypothetical protein